MELFTVLTQTFSALVILCIFIHYLTGPKCLKRPLKALGVVFFVALIGIFLYLVWLILNHPMLP